MNGTTRGGALAITAALVFTGAMHTASATGPPAAKTATGHTKVTIVRGTDAAGEVIRVGAMRDARGPFGSVRVRFPDFRLGGPVTCYKKVNDHRTIVGIRIAWSDGVAVGTNKGFIVFVIDRGTPGRNGDVIGTGFVAHVPHVCPAQGGATGFVNGDVRIDN